MNVAWVCPACDCAVDVPPDGAAAVCGTCGNVFTREAPPAPEVPSLATAIRYPFAGVGARVFIFTVAPLYAVCGALPLGPFAWMGQLLLGGYIAQWLWEILTRTALGKHEPPGSPFAEHPLELVGNFLRFLGALAVAFAPAAIFAVALVWNDVPREGLAGAAAGLLALAGLAYYPMALLLIGFSERWSAAFHVGFAVRSIARIGGDYLLCCIFFLVTFGVSTALETGIAALPGSVGFGVRFGARLAAGVVEVILWAIQMRAVGLVYLANKERLGWFR